MSDGTILTLSKSTRKPMGRRLQSLDSDLPLGLRGEFCAKLRSIAKKKTVAEIATAIGRSESYVRRLLSGTCGPDMDSLPDYAKALGLHHWTEFFHPAPKRR